MANLPVPVPRTWSVSETVTGAYMNSVRDGLNFNLGPPFAVIYQTTVQTLTTSVQAAVSFDTTTVDSYGGHSNVTNNTRYTAQQTGWYLVSATVQFQNIAGGNRSVQFAINGTLVNQFQMAVAASGTNVFTSITTTGIMFLNATDYIEAKAFQDSGGNVNTHTLGSAMCIKWVHN